MSKHQMILSKFGLAANPNKLKHSLPLMVPFKQSALSYDKQSKKASFDAADHAVIADFHIKEQVL
jgi:hypothetical protein